MTATDATSKTCWTPAWVRSVTGGRWLSPPAEVDATLTGLGIDSRSIKPGQAFLAVKGENYDGHAFIEQALAAGAAFAIIEREDAAATTLPRPLPGREGGIPNPTPRDGGSHPRDRAPGVLLVDNTVDALHRLADCYRELLRKSGCTVIAVVGSNGKTTTRHLIHAVLSSRFKGTQSPKSFNNHLGVPLTLLTASLEDRFVVAEVGTNHPGEIAALGKLLRPDAAVVTCIGHEHLEFFGDLRGVAEEEACICRFLSPGGVMFIEFDARAWIQRASTFVRPAEPVVYGLGKDGAVKASRRHGDRQRFAISDTVDIDLPLLAPHDVNNAMAAVAIGRWMGMDDAAIKGALEGVRPMPGRLEVKRFGEVTVIDDTYNANPDSMRAALDVLACYPSANDGQRIAVLGDMLELGAISQDAHREVGMIAQAMLASGVLDLLILVGPLMTGAVSVSSHDPHAPDVIRFETFNDQTLLAIAQAIQPKDTVLCKASRGLKLERLMPKIQQRFKTVG